MATQAILTAPGVLDFRETVVPSPGPRQLRIHLTQCGICAGEIDQWLGKARAYPIEIGHEIAGVVNALGTGTEPRFNVGDRVVAWIPGGGFSTEMLINEDQAIRIQDKVAYPAVVEPLACCVNAVELANPRLGDDVLIIGDGFMGRILQRLSVLKGARTITVASRRRNNEVTELTSGSTRVLHGGVTAVQNILTRIGATDGADVSYEVTGLQEGLDIAGRNTRMSGTVGIIGYHQGGSRSFELDLWNYRGLAIVNAHFRSLNTILAGMRTSVRLIEGGMLDAVNLITHRYSFQHLEEAFCVAAEKPPNFGKALIEF